MEEKKGEEGDSGREKEGVGIKEALRSRKGARCGKKDPLPPRPPLITLILILFKIYKK